MYCILIRYALILDLVDKVLEEDDIDKDGFISYPEFVLGRAGGRSVNLTSSLSTSSDNPEWNFSNILYLFMFV